VCGENQKAKIAKETIFLETRIGDFIKARTRDRRR